MLINLTVLRFTLSDLQCFDAVVREGGFQPAANKLNRTHPTIFAAVKKLERHLDIALLDRDGYRVQPTDAGLSFHQRSQVLLREARELEIHATQLALGVEPTLRVAIGDLAPLQHILKLLSHFFGIHKATRLDLQFEAVTGPRERLFDDDADLIVHHIEKTDTRLEWIDLATVELIPVVAPDFLPFPITPSLSIESIGDFTQCIIRDTARHSVKRDYFVIEGASYCTVADHQMKKDIILQGMAWGHLPGFMIQRELKEGKLLSLKGKNLAGMTEEIVLARRRDRPQGPTAKLLWEYMQEQAGVVQAALNQPLF